LSGWKANGDKCFYFSTDTVPKFADGIAKCKALSPVATLASVASQEELEWILGESQPYPRGYSIWIGIFLIRWNTFQKALPPSYWIMAGLTPPVRIYISLMRGEYAH
jgi:hypothetical protein